MGSTFNTPPPTGAALKETPESIMTTPENSSLIQTTETQLPVTVLAELAVHPARIDNA
jgi:hypothetical protein